MYVLFFHDNSKNLSLTKILLYKLFLYDEIDFASFLFVLMCTETKMFRMMLIAKLISFRKFLKCSKLFDPLFLVETCEVFNKNFISYSSYIAPFSTVFVYKMNFTCEKWNKKKFTEITRLGKARIHKVFFRPIYVDKTPNIQFPSIAPIEKYDPSHDVSVKFIEPVIKGDCSDCRLGNAGESQPIAQPWHKLIIFATLFF